MKHKIALLMCMPVILFGVSFKIISRPIFNEKIENVKAETVMNKEPEIKKNSFFFAPELCSAIRADANAL